MQTRIPGMRTRISSVLLVATICVVGCGDEFDFRITDAMRERAVRHTDPAAMIESAEALQRWHAEHATGVRLGPPIDERTLRATLGGLPCAILEELELLYRWHDGESTDQFLWNHEFLSLRCALEEYRRLRGFPLLRWEREWLPVLQFQDAHAASDRDARNEASKAPACCGIVTTDSFRKLGL